MKSPIEVKNRYLNESTFSDIVILANNFYYDGDLDPTIYKANMEPLFFLNERKYITVLLYFKLCLLLHTYKNNMEKFRLPDYKVVISKYLGSNTTLSKLFSKVLV